MALKNGATNANRLTKMRGVVTPIGTPLTEGDQVDEAGLRRLTRYLLDAGVNGILANGTMSGFAFLTNDQQLRTISIVADEVDGKLPVIGELGETSTSQALRLAKEIASLGVTHLSVLPPFTISPRQST